MVQIPTPPDVHAFLEAAGRLNQYWNDLTIKEIEVLSAALPELDKLQAAIRASSQYQDADQALFHHEQLIDERDEDESEANQVRSTLKNVTDRNELQHFLLNRCDQERLQIARALHDGPMQTGVAAIYGLHGLISIEDRPDQIAALKAVRDMLKDQAESLRAITDELRPPTLAKFGLVKAMRSYQQIFQDKNPGLVFEFGELSDVEPISETGRMGFYRIYQEALNNVVNHAHATQVKVQLQHSDNRLTLRIEDNGIGFRIPIDWLPLARTGRLGLVRILERVDAMGGWLDIRSSPGEGTELTVKIPVDNENALSTGS